LTVAVPLLPIVSDEVNGSTVDDIPFRKLNEVELTVSCCALRWATGSKTPRRTATRERQVSG
jgi:hypothetical protein